MNIYNALLFPKFKQKQVIQIRTTKQSMVYGLQIADIMELEKNHEGLQAAMDQTKQELTFYDNERQEFMHRISPLDYIVCLPKDFEKEYTQQQIRGLEAKKRFKNAVIWQIIRNREIAAQGSAKLRSLVKKIRCTLQAQSKLEQRRGMDEFKKALGLKLITEAREKEAIPAHVRVAQISDRI